ncbi:hypothetical protein Ruko_01720 [Ruthenibacterium sp. TH_2024_36131]|uniref:hypothetical protein n=1 Tax=Owariibacterium komagatae TaxID=3136601 RepID=UPI0038B2F416
MLAIRKCRMCGEPFDAVVGQDKAFMCPTCRDLAAGIITVESELAAYRDFESDFDLGRSREPDGIGNSAEPTTLGDRIEKTSDDSWAPRQREEMLRAAFESLGGTYEETGRKTSGSGRVAENKRRESAAARSAAKPAIRGDDRAACISMETDAAAYADAHKEGRNKEADFFLSVDKSVVHALIHAKVGESARKPNRPNRPNKSQSGPDESHDVLMQLIGNTGDTKQTDERGMASDSQSGVSPESGRGSKKPRKLSCTSTDSRAPTWAKKRQADIDAAFSTLRGSETLSLLRDHQRGTLVKSGSMIYAGGKGILPPDEIDPDVLDFASTIPIPDEKGEPGPGPFLPQEEINRIFDEVFANDSETIEFLDETLYDTDEVD